MAEELGVSSEDAIGAAKEGGKIRRERVADNMEPKAIFLDFALDKCTYKILSNHEIGGIKFDQVVCLGHQLDDGVFYVGVSTCSMVCNVFRGIASGWDFTYMGDGTLHLRHHREREWATQCQFVDCHGVCVARV